MSNLILVFKGVALGVANIIPGLSGGTVAVILGVYQALIDALASLLTFQKKQFMHSLIFLLLVGFGGLAGVFAFSFIIDWALGHYLESVSFFFIGVILSSIPYIIQSESIKIVTFSRVFICSLGFILGLGLVIGKYYFFSEHLVLDYSSGYLFFSVVIAAATMIIPGISGSLVLVLLGTYSVVISAIKDLVFFDLAIIAMAVMVGIFGCSKLLQFCIKRYFQLTMSLVVGLMLGTLPGLYHGFSESLLVFNGLFFILGVALVWSASLLS